VATGKQKSSAFAYIC